MIYSVSVLKVALWEVRLSELGSCEEDEVSYFTAI